MGRGEGRAGGEGREREGKGGEGREGRGGKGGEGRKGKGGKTNLSLRNPGSAPGNDCYMVLAIAKFYCLPFDLKSTPSLFCVAGCLPILPEHFVLGLGTGM